ncbi:MAG: MBL fold metallo-hydrolase [Armatimonadota bacterium]|nr:MBL fold metallo-hydrolase [Armatimonadota bacterium]
MKLHLLGTGGADGIPSFFCDSELSQHAREKGKEDIRTRTGAVVDGHLKVDFGPDTFMQAAYQGLRPVDWKWIIVTHSHFDHFDAGLLQYCLPPFVPADQRPPEVLGNPHVLAELEGAFPAADQIQTRVLRSFESATVGDYEVTPVSAYHKLDEDSVNFIVEGGGKRLLYATDTGVYQEPTWDFISGTRFDCVVIESTDGFSPSDYWGHLSCAEAVAMIDRMRKISCVDDRTVVATTHHADSGGANHAQLVEFFTPHEIQVGYDGMLLDF